MISKTNFKDLLLYLGFKKEGNIFKSDNSMLADFNQKKLYYPERIKGRERNDNFNAPENFVVFECVHRLLTKGYRPEDIELEREWSLGHNKKSGRADICISDNGKTLFIIECKTWDKEFKKALKDTENDGGQLFSYWQQEQSCKWLILYSSNFSDKALVYKAPSISCTDDPNLLVRKDVKLFTSAHTVEEKFEAWKETYNSNIHNDIIFNDKTKAYEIGVKPLTKSDLKEFSSEDKIINKFEEILRHNNVSDKENAFNRLIALFICKLVDEITKNDTDEVEFQYKHTDSYEILQDRLQRLHRDGMEKFMQEKIHYVSSDYPEKLFANYTSTKRIKAIEDLRNTIRILKFYSNNDFSFKDVHNEELFYQNGKILVEMVKLFENYKIVYSSRHQFLGDLFEQLLNRGFKQNEGQFFTPMPIVRFIWDSLPLKNIIKSERGTIYPKIVDYACGAGHFLIEAIEAVNYFIKSDDGNTWVQNNVFGIEKDYRLARTAKISLFMNGAGEGNIIFGDGLENVPDKGISDNSFDILVANPPYAIKYFKQHLALKNNSFSLMDMITPNSNQIQTLFVERIGQLLKPKGIAAVILPASILTNNAQCEIGAREYILKNFFLRAVVFLESLTFGETDVPTVIVFLEKFSEPPKISSLAQDTVNAVFSGQNLSDWTDNEIFELYLNQIGITPNQYIKFINHEYSLDEIKNIAYFEMYLNDFKKIIDNTKVSLEEQIQKFYAYSHLKEKEKLLYFTLICNQKTVFVAAPKDIKEQQEFLGYKWSKRAGNEGIQIIAKGGLLYNDHDRLAEYTIAYMIRNAFNNSYLLNNEIKYCKIMNTRELFDFSRSSFNKAIEIKIGGKKNIFKFKEVPLGTICEIKIGGTPDRNNRQFYKGHNLWVKISDIKGQTIYDTQEKITDEAVKLSNVKLIPKGTTLLSFKLSIGKTALAGKDLYTNEAVAALIPRGEQILDKYLYYLFREKLISIDYSKKAKGETLNLESLNEIQIPLPPVSIQQEIIDQCSAIDQDINVYQNKIFALQEEIENLFLVLDNKSVGGQSFDLSDKNRFKISIGKRILKENLISEGNIPVFSANVFTPFGYTNDLLIDDFSSSSIIWGIDGDWQINFMEKDYQFYPTDHCGVLKCLTDEINPYYLFHILKKKGIEKGFGRAIRASQDRISSIKFTASDRESQDKIIAEIKWKEKEISDLDKHILVESDKLLKVLKNSLSD